MTPREMETLRQALTAMRDMATLALGQLGPNPDLCPKCGGARWFQATADVRFCDLCGHEWTAPAATEPVTAGEPAGDDLVRLQEGETNDDVPGA